LILQNFNSSDGKLLYVSGEIISNDLNQQLISEGYNVKRIINYSDNLIEKFNDDFIEKLKLKCLKSYMYTLKIVLRGDMIDDEAMIDALNKRKIYALGLDVYKGEPNLNPGYLNIKNVFILPHLGSATKETRTAMANLAIDNLDEFFKTGNCKNKVN
jgi:hypothetical protein